MAFAFSVPDNWFKIINDVIINDEGGWVFTNNPNDPGGMTYGGMTFQVFNSVMRRDYQESMSPEAFKHGGQANTPDLQQRVCQVYYNEFAKHLPTSEYKDLTAILSCAINLGPAVAISCIRSKGPFLHNWRKVYIDKVQDNCDAWDAYIHAVELIIPAESDALAHNLVKEITKERNITPPSFKRWKYLEGWLNRVARYET